MSLQGIGEQAFELQDLAPGVAQTVEYPVDTSLRPDEYSVVARLDLPEPQGESLEERLSVRLVPRRPPHQFPVLMWGIYGGVDEEAERLQRIGFTHVLGLGADYGRIWDANQPIQAADDQTVARTKRTLDEALSRDLTVVASLSPGAAMRSREELQRVGRDGKPYAVGRRRLRAAAAAAGFLLPCRPVGGPDLRAFSGLWRGADSHRGPRPRPAMLSPAGFRGFPKTCRVRDSQGSRDVRAAWTMRSWTAFPPRA